MEELQAAYPLFDRPRYPFEELGTVEAAHVADAAPSSEPDLFADTIDTLMDNGLTVSPTSTTDRRTDSLGEPFLSCADDEGCFIPQAPYFYRTDSALQVASNVEATLKTQNEYAQAYMAGWHFSACYPQSGYVLAKKYDCVGVASEAGAVPVKISALPSMAPPEGNAPSPRPVHYFTQPLTLAHMPMAARPSATAPPTVCATTPHQQLSIVLSPTNPTLHAPGTGHSRYQHRKNRKRVLRLTLAQRQLAIEKSLRSGTARTRHVCEHCGQMLSNRFALKRHLNLHMDLRPYCCECGYDATSAATLHRHQGSVNCPSRALGIKQE